MKTHAILLATLLAAAGLAGCANTTDPGHGNMTPTTQTTPTGSGNASGDAEAKSEVTFVAKQSAPPGPDATNITYSFEGPSKAAAGWVTLHLQNQGFEPHQAGLIKLNGMSYDAYVASLSNPNMSADPHDMDAKGPEPAGGVGLALPFGNATATLLLEEGDYAIVCVIPGPMGAHMAHGMVAPLKVVKGAGAAAPEPQANATVTLSDYAFTLSGNLTAGRHVLRVVNNGTHHHESPFVRLVGNATPDEFFAAVETGQGPPPADYGAGGWSLLPGKAQYVTVDLTPGRYLWFCFEQDSAQDPPHVVKGMILVHDVA